MELLLVVQIGLLFIYHLLSALSICYLFDPFEYDDIFEEEYHEGQ